MSEMAHGSRSGPRDPIAFAVVLIIVGVAALVLQNIDPGPDLGGWIVLIIGVGFLGAFLYTRQYGFLVPAGIMSGIGIGILAAQTQALTGEASGGLITLGLGFGFVAIWVIATIANAPGNHWWPLIPGGILVVVGGALAIGGQAVDLLQYWGIILIALGLLVLGRAWMGSRPSA